MTVHLLVLLSLLLGGGAQSASPGVAETKGDDNYLMWDGSKNPGQIPEWLTWEQGFTVLDLWRGKDSGFNHDLRQAMSSTEFVALERAAAEQRERRARLESEAEAMRQAMGATDPQSDASRAYNERAFVMELAYRRSLLAIRDRLLESMSPESQAVLQSWMNDMKHDIKVRVPKTDVARWRMPE